MLKYIYTNQYGDSIEFHSGSPFKITDIDGQSVNEVSFSESSTINQIGSTVTARHVEPKPFTIEGDFIDTFKNKRKLIDTIIPGKGKWRMIDDNLDVYLDVEVRQTPDVTPKDKVYKIFDFELYAAFPYWMSESKISVSFTEMVSMFRLPREFSNIVQWKISEKRIQQIQTIINEGSDETGFIIKFKAKTNVKAPEVLNILTQENIRFTDLTMNPGDIVEVSTYENQKYAKLIKEDSEENIFYLMDDESTFFKLKKYENVIRYGASSGSENLEVYIYFRNTYAGV